MSPFDSLEEELRQIPKPSAPDKAKEELMARIRGKGNETAREIWWVPVLASAAALALILSHAWFKKNVKINNDGGQTLQAEHNIKVAAMIFLGREGNSARLAFTNEKDKSPVLVKEGDDYAGHRVLSVRRDCVVLQAQGHSPLVLYR